VDSDADVCQMFTEYENMFGLHTSHSSYKEAAKIWRRQKSLQRKK
jgi:hypothetical protein